MRKRAAMQGFERSAEAADISGRNSARKSPERSEQVRHVLEQAPAIIWTTDANLRVTSCAGTLLQTLGLGANAIPGMTLYEYLGVNDPSAPYIAEHYQALEGNSVNVDGHYKGWAFSACISPLRDAHSRIVGTVGVALEVTAQKRSEESIRHLASRDPLTDLSNHRALLEAFDAELQRSDRTGRPFAVLLLDMDRLKEINDRYGHLVGNRALLRLAAILKRTCRSIDTSARYGGDEFAVLLVETDQEAALLVARRIKALLAHDLEEPPFTVSAGVVVYPQGGRTVEELLGAADRDLYRNKLRFTLQSKMRAAQVDSPEDGRAGGNAERRRSERFFLDVPVLVHGENIEKQPFHEETFTITVNAHGALLLLAAKLKLGQTVYLTNQRTHSEQQATAVRFDSPYGGLTQVAVEFPRPAPEFWLVDPLPDGWKKVMQTAAADSELRGQ